MIDCVAAVRRRETELLSQLRAAFAGDPAVQAFIADRPSIEATLRSLENTCQLTDVIVRERSVELLLLKDDIAQRMTSLLQTSLAQPPPRMRSTHVQFIPAPRDQAFPVGRLDFVDQPIDKTSSIPDVVDRGERPQGDGHDAVPDGAADSDDPVRNRALKPEVEIKRREIEVEDDNKEYLSGEVAGKRLITTCDRETSTVSSCVQSTSTTMNRCVHVEDKLTSTSSQQTVDQSTLTMSPSEPCHRATDTETLPDSSKAKSTSSQCSQTSASVFHMRSKYIETEPLPVVSKWTLTERPFQMDKVNHV